MAPSVALAAMEGSGEQLRVLDPMAGSGTVVAVARANGHRAIGVDVDPLAVLMARVWTTSIDRERARSEALDVLGKAKATFRDLRSRDGYPANADEETRKFTTYWFDQYARRQLAALASAIDEVEDARLRDVMWCGFSRLIIAKQAGASLALDLSHSRPHRAFTRAPTKPFSAFISAVERVVVNCIDRRAPGRGPASTLHQGDARALPVASSSIDVVVTSPPYLNAIDYMRCSKFSLVWMGHSISSLRLLRSTSVGTEAAGGETDNPNVRTVMDDLKLKPTLDSRHAAILGKYVKDISEAVSEVARVLRPGGRAVYVVGENTLRGTYVRNAKIVRAVGEMAGLRLASRSSRALPASRRYLPPPSARSGAAMDGRMRREIVLTFER
jgi:adenine-specific DNA methylase